MILNENFHETITTQNKVPDCYHKLYFTHDTTSIYTSEYNTITNSNTVVNVSLFPSYLQPEFKIDNTVGIVKIPQKKIVGYAVLIKKHTDLETLFKAEYKKSFRANILRFVNRFEDCFNANYKLFFGAISKDEYTFLMNTLHTMLTTRFDQRNDSNKVLKNWDTYIETTFGLIKEKKASLFVIYDDTTPVHICLNHHFDNILFVSVPSYDINYAKFALGNVSLYKLLEWSVNNKYEVMDMAQGYLEYKRRWSNLIYDFDHHIIYKKQSLKARLSATIEINKLKFKNFLKSNNIDDLIDKIKKKLRKAKPYQEDCLYVFEDAQISDTDAFQKIMEQTTTYNYIQKPINDFLYTNKEHINDLRIFEVNNKKDYLLAGKKTTKKLTLN